MDDAMSAEVPEADIHQRPKRKIGCYADLDGRQNLYPMRAVT
jgi:hypothetical protein